VKPGRFKIGKPGKRKDQKRLKPQKKEKKEAEVKVKLKEQSFKR
jgi:hypothetical protein